jgi:ABC-2 type transport system ATP-binding protein
VADHLVKEFTVPERGTGLAGSLRTLFSRAHHTVRAVDDVSFEIAGGTKVAYIGANGAGKSTTIKMLTGVMTPTSGRCVVGGIEPYRKRRLAAHRMGVVFGQRSQLWWDLSVPDAFRILRRLYEIPDTVYRRNLRRFEETLEIGALGTAPVRTLSLGQRMRAEIAASLLHDPTVLFLDEPTIGLDLILKDAVRDLLNRIAGELGTTILLTSHDLSDIVAVCDQVLVIDRGRIIHQGSIAALLATAESRSIVIDRRGGGPADEVLRAAAGLDGVHARPAAGGRVEVVYRPDRITAGEVLSFLLARFEITEWYAPEPDLGDVIRAIYAGSVVPSAAHAEGPAR